MEEDKVTLRIVLDAIILFSAVFGWWYVALPLALACAWSFPVYAEAVAIGFIYDLLYDLPRGFAGFYGLFIGVAIFAAVSYLKMVVRE